MANIHYLIVLLILKVTLVNGTLKFQSLNCTLLNPKLVSKEECRIKAIDRAHNAINLRFKTRETFSDLKVEFKFFKRERGGWHPFLYAMTVDVCKFFGNPNRYPVPAIIFHYVKDSTNFNHSCPILINSDVNLINWQLDESSVVSRFPVEAGEYGLHTTWFTKNSSFLQIKGSTNYVT